MVIVSEVGDTWAKVEIPRSVTGLAARNLRHTFISIWRRNSLGNAMSVPNTSIPLLTDYASGSYNAPILFGKLLALRTFVKDSYGL